MENVMPSLEETPILVQLDENKNVPNIEDVPPTRALNNSPEKLSQICVTNEEVSESIFVNSDTAYFSVESLGKTSMEVFKNIEPSTEILDNFDVDASLKVIQETNPSNHYDDILLNNQTPSRNLSIEEFQKMNDEHMPEPEIFENFVFPNQDMKNMKDEVFHDAVQFFKDPSAFDCLTNVGKAHTESKFMRDSLFMHFDPLHASRQSPKVIESNPNCLTSEVGDVQFVVKVEKNCTHKDEDMDTTLEHQAIDEQLQTRSLQTEVECDENDSAPRSSDVNDSTPRSSDVNDSTPRSSDVNDSTPRSSDVNNSTPRSSDKVGDMTILAEHLSKLRLCSSTSVASPQPSNDKVIDIIKVEESSEGEVEIRSESKLENKSENNDSVFVSTEPINKNVNNVAFDGILDKTLMSFESPVKIKHEVMEDTKNESFAWGTPPPRLYNKEEVAQAVKAVELEQQHLLLMKQQEMEKLTQVLRGWREVLVLHQTTIVSLVDKEKQLSEAHAKQSAELKTTQEDFQNVENIFADFHKRYENAKAMIKTFRENESRLQLQIAELKSQVEEKDKKYDMLQSRAQVSLDDATSEIMNARKTAEAQIAVLNAQLKKAEMKNSSLESDNQKLREENSKFSGICDDLMAKFSQGQKD